MSKIGLLGGTFDPPHMGHLLIAEEVYNKLGLDEVWFIPSNDPPHKDRSQTSVGHRMEMTKLAVSDNEHFLVSTIEVERAGISYTIDTARILTEAYATHNFYFIIGADMVEYLPKWHHIDELRELVSFVGVKRKGYQLNSPYSIMEVEIPMFEVSSSLLRQRIMHQDSTKYLLPQTVENYIREHDLYGTE